MRAIYIGLALLGLLLGCGEERRDEARGDGEDASFVGGPNLILIVVDNLRADHVGVYGYGRPTTPHIDALARDGIVFRRAYSPSSWTKPAIGALFTSRHPSQHGAVSFDRNLDSRLPTLAESLSAAGYTTVGVTGNFIHIAPTTGMVRGFDRWASKAVRLVEGDSGDAIWTEQAPNGEMIRVRAPHAHEINEEVADLLDQIEARPLFLYIHYMEPHASFDPPEPFRSRFTTNPSFEGPAEIGSTNHVVSLATGQRTPLPGEIQRLIDLYDAEIAAVDAGIGALLEDLEARGLLENAVVAVVADHGEAFGEHGSFFHGLDLFDKSLAIPFVLRDLRATPTFPGGATDSRPVDLLDLPTTLLALAGVEPPAEMLGRDLLVKQGPSARDLIAELHPDPYFEEYVHTRSQRLALTRWPWKLIVDRSGETSLWNLEEGAEAATDAAETPFEALSTDALHVTRALDQSFAKRESQPRKALDVKTLEGLRALGYVD